MSGINIFNVNDDKLRGDKPTNRFNFANNSRMEILKRAKQAININKNKKIRNDKGAFYPLNKPKQIPVGSFLRMPPTALSINNYSIQKGGGRYTQNIRNKFTNLLGKRKEQFETRALAKQGLTPIKEAKTTETKSSLVNLNMMIDEIETEISDGRWEDIDLKQVRGIFNEIKKVGYDMNVEEITNYRIRLGAITRFHDYLEDQGEELFKETIYYGIFSSILLLMVFQGTINLQKKERTIIINDEIKVISKLESFNQIINLFDDYRVRFNIPSVRRQAEARMNDTFDELPRKERRLRDKIDDITNKTKAEIAFEANNKIAELADEKDPDSETVRKIISATKTEGVNKKKKIPTKYGKVKIEDLPRKLAMEDVKKSIVRLVKLKDTTKKTNKIKRQIKDEEQELKKNMDIYEMYGVLKKNEIDYFDDDKSDDSKDSDYKPDDDDDSKLDYIPVKKLKNDEELVEIAIEDALERNKYNTYEDFSRDLKNDETSIHLLDYLKDVLVNAILEDKYKTITIFDKEIDMTELLEQVSKNDNVKPVSDEKKEYLPVMELKTKKDFEGAIVDAFKKNGYNTFSDFDKDYMNDEISEDLLEYLRNVLVNALLLDSFKTITIFEKKIDMVDFLEQLEDEF